MDRLKARRPRLAIILLLLTAMVSLIGWRFASDMNVRQADGFTREACRLFSVWRQQPPPPAAGIGADEAANRASVIVGRRVALPRDPSFTFESTTAERKAGRQKAAAVRFHLGPEPYLLMVVPGGGVLGASGHTASSPFPGASFLSGARAGVSFVLWKRDGLFYCLVSDQDLTRVFEVVRRHFP
jgi:hypothetical protein